MPHYYSAKAGGRGARKIVSAFIRGVGVEFVTGPGVFSPDRIDKGTQLLLEHAIVPERGLILDVGCGYGVIGITLAKAYPGLKVYMVDINLDAVKLSRMNSKRNGVDDRVTVLHGDLYEPIPPGIMFDTILSNPPLSAGSGTMRRLIEGALERLRPGGMLQLVVWRAHSLVSAMLDEVFGEHIVLAAKKGYKVLAARKP